MMKCPCLHSGIAPICSADTEMMRIPTAEQQARACLTDQHRRCDIFRRFLGLPVAVRRPPAAAESRETGWSEPTIYSERGS